jgi:pepF/M3 family oligoendopeptidase
MHPDSAVRVQICDNRGMASSASLGALPRWDLSNVYPSLESAELKAAIKSCERQIRALEKYLDENDIQRAAKKPSAAVFASTLASYLDRFNTLMRLHSTISTYIYAFVSTDSFDQAARKALSSFEPLGVRIGQIETRFRGWLGAHADRLPAAIEHGNDTVRSHAFFLNEAAEQSRYLMSDAEENLAGELDLSGANAWSKLQGNIVSQLTVDFNRKGAGVRGAKTEKLSMPALINIMQHDADGTVRRRAYEAEHAAWKSVEETLSAAMNGVKGAASTLNRHRGRKDDLHPALDAARIDRRTLDAMLGAMQDSFPQFRRYLRAKAKRFGHEGGLPWWDLFAPVGRDERTYSWSDARGLLEKTFGNFSPNLLSMTRTAFDSNWIDAEQRPGKRAGAFCTEVLAVDESRILCNYDGSLDQVSTVAHELGHAFHNQCLVGKPYLQTITPMTLAETASIFCESLIIDAALEESSGPAAELAILETDLIGKTQVVVDITSRFLFETEVFQRRASAELSADDLSEAMLRCQRETYGDGLDERYMHKYMWTWKPHYYFAGLSFYNFPYAFGLLFGTGLYALYRERGQRFVGEYENLLGSTGMADAVTLAKRFKIDLRKKAFWKASLDVIAERIDRYCAL